MMLIEQDTAKSFAYYNVAGACRLPSLVTHTSVYLKILSYIHFALPYIPQNSPLKRCRFLNIFTKLQSKIQENRQDITNSST